MVKLNSRMIIFLIIGLILLMLCYCILIKIIINKYLGCLFSLCIKISEGVVAKCKFGTVLGPVVNLQEMNCQNGANDFCAVTKF